MSRESTKPIAPPAPRVTKGATQLATAIPLAPRISGKSTTAEPTTSEPTTNLVVRVTRTQKESATRRAPLTRAPRGAAVILASHAGRRPGGRRPARRVGARAAARPVGARRREPAQPDAALPGAPRLDPDR